MTDTEGKGTELTPNGAVGRDHTRFARRARYSWESPMGRTLRKASFTIFVKVGAQLTVALFTHEIWSHLGQ